MRLALLPEEKSRPPDGRTRETQHLELETLLWYSGKVVRWLSL